MTKLRDLERRLEEEPENLGLRVVVAGAMREAGRHAEAVELYRSVAIAYQDQGRSQQAIAVCRSILEIAPDDPRCHALLATLVAGHKSASQPAPAPGLGRDVLEVGAPGERPRTPTMPGTAPPAEAPRARSGAPAEMPERPRTPTTPGMPPPAAVRAAPAPAEDEVSGGVPVRISQYDQTPLPAALPYHVADPTTRTVQRISAPELPLALDDDDPAADLETRQRPRLERDPLGLPFDDDVVTAFSADDEAQTDPRDLPRGTRRVLLPLRAPPGDDDDVAPAHAAPARGAPAHLPPERAEHAARAALAFAFFAPLPAERRGAVLARFSRRSVPAGTTVIRQGEQGHPLVLVGSGRLEIRAERPAGDTVELGPIGPGDHVGEAALLARAPAAAHVVAATEAELLLLSPRDFYEIAGAYPALWAQLKELAARRTREHAALLGG